MLLDTFVSGIEKYNLVYIKATPESIIVFKHESFLKKNS